MRQRCGGHSSLQLLSPIGTGRRIPLAGRRCNRTSRRKLTKSWKKGNRSSTISALGQVHACMTTAFRPVRGNLFSRVASPNLGIDGVEKRHDNRSVSRSRFVCMQGNLIFRWTEFTSPNAAWDSCWLVHSSSISGSSTISRSSSSPAQSIPLPAMTPAATPLTTLHRCLLNLTWRSSFSSSS